MSGELNFLLKMRDEASGVLKQYGSTVEAAGAAHKHAADHAEHHEASLKKLVSTAGEAAEAFGAIWAASELSEKTLGAWSEMEVVLLNLKQAANATKDQMGELQEAIEKTAAHSLNQTSEQIAAVMTSAARLGVEGPEAIKEFSTVVSQLATVTGASTQAVTEGMGQILASTGQVQDGAKQFGDALAYLSDKTRGGGEALLHTTERLTMMTAGMKLSIPEVLGMASAVSNLGVSGERASMVVGQALTRITDMASQGDEKLRILAAATHMTAEQFKELAAEHPAEALNAFLKAAKESSSMSEFFKAFGLGGRYMETTLKALAEQVDTLKDKEKEAGEASKGSLGKDNEEYMKLFAAAIHEAMEAIDSFGKALGKAAAPEFFVLVKAGTNAIEALSGAFNRLPFPIQSLTASLLIGIPMLAAAAKAFSFLRETLLVGTAVYARYGGLFGTLAKSVLTFKAVEEETKIATEALTGASHQLAAAETEVATGAKAAEAGIAGVGVESRAATAGIAAVTTELNAAAAATSRFAAFAAGLRSRAGLGLGLGVMALLNAPSDEAGIGANAKGWNDWVDKSTVGKWLLDHGITSKAPEWEESHKADLLKKAQEIPTDLPPVAGEGAKSQGTKPVDPYNLDPQLKKIDDLKKKQDELNQLRKMTPGQLETLGINQQELSVMQKIINEQTRALDPMNKLRDSWKDQLRSAQALTKEAENQAEIEQAVDEAKRTNQRFGAAEEAEMRAQKAAVDQAKITTEFTKQMQTASDQLALAAQFNPLAKNRLETEQKIAAAIREQGYSYQQAAELEKTLDLAKQTEALGGVVDSQKNEIAQLEIMGHYREADLKTLQEIQALEKQGVQVRGTALEGEISGFNRQMSDLKEIQTDLKSVEDSLSSSLTQGITGAISGQKGAMQNALKGFGEQMLNMGLKKMFDRMFEESGIDKMLLGSGLNAAKGLTGNLTDAAEKMVGQMSVQAGVVYVTGASIPGAAVSGLEGLSSTSPGQPASLAGGVPNIFSGTSPGSGVLPNFFPSGAGNFKNVTGVGSGILSPLFPTAQGVSGFLPAAINPGGGAAQDALAKQAYQFWLTQGADPMHALQLVGGARGENALGSLTVGDKGTAFGQSQWHPDRVSDIASGTGIDVKTAPFMDQLKAQAWEMKSGRTGHADWNDFMATKDPYSAQKELVHGYEGSANQAEDIQLRLGYSRHYEDVIKNNPQASLGNLPTSDTSAVTGQIGDNSQLTQAMQTWQQQMPQVTKQVDVMQQSLQQQVPKIDNGLTALSGDLSQGSSAVGKGVEQLVSSLDSKGGSGGLGNLLGGGGGLGSLFGSGGGGSADDFALGAELVGGFHAGGMVGGPPTFYRQMSMNLFAHAPRYHEGLGTDEFPAVLQRGERVLTSNDNVRTMHMITGLTDAMQQRSQAGSPRPQTTNHYTVNNNISSPNADSFRKSSGQIAAEASVHIQRAGIRNG